MNSGVLDSKAGGIKFLIGGKAKLLYLYTLYANTCQIVHNNTSGIPYTSTARALVYICKHIRNAIGA